ncbi:MAG TPA: DUF3667 domain-containing protein [Rhodanobacter sp.]
MLPLTSHEGLYCANCGTPMQGEFCHACGQSIHSVLKPMHHMLEETVETVLHIDGRIVHTLPPLFLKPGFLTLEYFGGRRVRYIAPFRLMFVLCLLSFFVCHLAIDHAEIHPVPLKVQATNADFAPARNAGAVQELLGEQLAQTQKACDQALGTLIADCTQRASDMQRKQAATRLVALGADPALASSAAVPMPVDTSPEHGVESNSLLTRHFTVDVSWLPDFVNARLTRATAHIQANVLALKFDSSRSEALERLKTNIFSVLPATMFVSMPLFALLLKLFYVFRRRLYMEHLIVALHSHAYLFLSLLLGVSLSALSGWLAPHAAWTARPLVWLEWLLALWIPAYLLIMQKRIYRQGWPMTVLKFCCIGWCYIWLLTAALIIAVVLGMVR